MIKWSLSWEPLPELGSPLRRRLQERGRSWCSPREAEERLNRSLLDWGRTQLPCLAMWRNGTRSRTLRAALSNDSVELIHGLIMLVKDCMAGWMKSAKKTAEGCLTLISGAWSTVRSWPFRI